MSALMDAIRSAPNACGVYIMKDAAGKVIYVGKARNLRKRLSSYMREAEGRYQVRFLVKKIRDIEYILTSSETEALLLENNLIKKYTPRYNIQLKDDKNYLCIKVDMRQEFPALELVRRIDDTGARYFGPYPSATSIRAFLKTLYRIFPLRRCSDTAFRHKKKPCIYRDMNQCIAPCAAPEKKEEYRAILAQALLVLEGKSREILKVLKSQMQEAAEQQDFERAALIRDTIRDQKELFEKQGVVSARLSDRDVLGDFVAGDVTNIAVLFIRGGRLLHKKEFSVASGIAEEETLSQFILGYYSLHVLPPDEIVVRLPVPDRTALETLLFERFSKKIRIIVPRDTGTKKLMDMARLNASTFSPSRGTGLELLRDALGLASVPHRIECFDVAHMHGRQNTCAMTVMIDGVISKSDYRLFNIAEESHDDLRMLYDSLKRRFSHTEWPFPDLLVIDGGKGQLLAAIKLLDELGLENIVPIAITKDERNSIFLRNRKNPLVLAPRHEGLKLLQLLREEAHRFANVQLRRLLKKHVAPRRKN